MAWTSSLAPALAARLPILGDGNSWEILSLARSPTSWRQKLPQWHFSVSSRGKKVPNRAGLPIGMAACSRGLRPGNSGPVRFASRSEGESPITNAKPRGRTVAHGWFGLDVFDRRGVCSGVYLGVIQWI